MVKVSEELARIHYAHLKDEPFFENVIKYLCGEPYGEDYKRVLALVYEGEDAISKVRKLAGATNPEQAESVRIRGQYGRITSKGIYENVLHCSENEKEAEREIKLWFKPDEVVEEIYPVKVVEEKIKIGTWAN